MAQRAPGVTLLEDLERGPASTIGMVFGVDENVTSQCRVPVGVPSPFVSYLKAHSYLIQAQLFADVEGASCYVAIRLLSGHSFGLMFLRPLFA